MFVFLTRCLFPWCFCQCEPIISIWAGFSFLFFILYYVPFFWGGGCFSLILAEHQHNNAPDCTCNWVVLCLSASFFSFPCGCVPVWFFFFFLMNVCVSFWCTCVCVSVSAENLEKSLRQMERQLLQLERDLETFSSPDDPNDMFFTKMAISFL